MSTTLHIQGDSVVNANAVDVRFAEPIVIEPYSEIALDNAVVTLAEPVSNFNVTASVNDTFTIGTSTTQATVTLTAGTYTDLSLLTQMERQANFIGSATNATAFQGLDFVFGKTAENKSQIQVWNANLQQPYFDDNTLWAEADDVTTADNSVTNVGGDGDIVALANVPRVSAIFNATLSAPNTVAGFIAAANEDFNVYGLRWDGTGNYFALVNDADNAVTAVAGAGDVIAIQRYGQTLIITINGVAQTFTGITNDAHLDSASWHINMEGAFTVSSVTCTSLGKTDSVSAQIVWGSALLATIMGYDAQHLTLNEAGDPATFLSPLTMDGVFTYPVILLKADGLPSRTDSHVALSVRSAGTTFVRGSFGSYDIVASIPTEVVKKETNSFSYSAGTPRWLKLKNPRPVNLSKLRLSLIGDVDGGILEFVGRCAYTLMIRPESRPNATI